MMKTEKSSANSRSRLGREARVAVPTLHEEARTELEGLWPSVSDHGVNR